ncbi:MAG: hypothetical protein M1828_006946 [Chrysothrix sp. TS-e1954]|nr:MAG: hypothetical protein M1828_006946 [Chrysothrix sp. TS-e1954]
MDGSGNSSPTTSSTLPTHHRAPSLGELHQELENEQEAQVNRLLGMIREQQAEIANLQQSASSTPSTTEPSSSVPGSSSLPTSALPIRSRTPSSSRPSSIAMPPPPTHNPGTTPVITATTAAARASSSLSRHSSRRSRTSSHTSERFAGAAAGERERDDVSLWQTETAMVQRENQMLKTRIRELERMIHSMSTETAGEQGSRSDTGTQEGGDDNSTHCG